MITVNDHFLKTTQDEDRLLLGALVALEDANDPDYAHAINELVKWIGNGGGIPIWVLPKVNGCLLDAGLPTIELEEDGQADMRFGEGRAKERQATYNKLRGAKATAPHKAQSVAHIAAKYTPERPWDDMRIKALRSGLDEMRSPLYACGAEAMAREAEWNRVQRANSNKASVSLNMPNLYPTDTEKVADLRERVGRAISDLRAIEALLLNLGRELGGAA